MRALKLTEMTSHAIKSLFKSFDTILTDCDGVLWLEDDLIKGSETVMNGFRKMGKRIFFITNNSSKTRNGAAEKCKKLGFQAEKEEIISTSYLAASYLTDIGFKKKVYVFGSSGVTEELKYAGHKSNEPGPDPMVDDLKTLLRSKIKLDPDVGAVIVAYDDHISLPKIIKAATYVKDPKCLYLGTSAEGRKIIKGDFSVPGAGCMAAAVTSCSGRQPVILGKPSEYLMDVLIRKLKVEPGRTLMIGDSARTDIMLGNRCGFQTLLVLSGLTTAHNLQEWQNSQDERYKGYIPNYYVQSLGDLTPFLAS
ncbi:glycerol-3-phosphate phosphatase-like isoform X1 [Schistocerca cancellata]|uniref:glycerol-3-phosphate phosphatase-like isoform X1 n=1 Tax=Schistocerca cancellata TaxID=274614 RepID=UPI002118B885|nr:glycerol-3-phosphate phosphatase-like isoform X1 [Schistocerca cancellata]